MSTTTTTAKRSRDHYLDLVRRFPLRPIRGDAEHGRAKRAYVRASHSATGVGARDYLDVLAGLIADYERRTHQTIDTSKITAAELVRHRMQERGLSVSALAKTINIAQPNLSAMLNGRRAWSKAAIRSLSQMFGVAADRFLE